MEANLFFQDIQRILKEKCECSQPVNRESIIMEDLQLDSLALMTFVSILEEKYDLCMEELEENPETIGQLVDEIERQMKLRKGNTA